MNTVPDFYSLYKNNKNYVKAYSAAMQYYSSTFSMDDMKNHTEEWLDRKFINISSNEFNGIGQVAWLMNHSCYVDSKVLKNAVDKVNKFYTEENDIIAINEDDSPQDKFRKRTKNVILELESYLKNVYENRYISKPIVEVIGQNGTFDIGRVIKHFTEIEENIDNRYTNKEDAERMLPVLSEITGKLIFLNFENNP